MYNVFFYKGVGALRLDTGLPKILVWCSNYSLGTCFHAKRKGEEDFSLKKTLRLKNSSSRSWLCNKAIYPKYSKLGFPTGRDSATFRDSGTGKTFLSRDKGTTGQAQNLSTGRDGPGQLNSGTGRARTAKIRDGTRDKTRQSRKTMF